MSVGLAIGKNDALPWLLVPSRWYYNQFVPPVLSYTTKGKTFWQPEIWRALAPISIVTLTRPENNSTYSVLACLPSPYFFFFFVCLLMIQKDFIYK